MNRYEFYCRAFQKSIALGQLLWIWKEPMLVKGPGSVLSCLH